MIFWTLWLSEDFGFGPIEIGWMGTLIGVAELIGLLFAMVLIDPIGKRRGTLIGLMGTSICFALIFLFQQPILAVRIVLILTAIVIEFAITASIPLFAEQSPKARATVFSLVAFGNTIGIGLGPPATTYLWTRWGLNAVVMVGVTISLLTFLLVWRFLFDSPS
jgi:predicted MFS family arabinose efflux permease